MNLDHFRSTVPSMQLLNAFARSDRCRSGVGCQYPWLARHIYTMKDRLIQAAQDVGAVTSRHIVVETTCRGCAGSGIWSGGRRKRECNRCDGTGVAILYFREVWIGRTLYCTDWPCDDLLWHQPLPRTQAVNPILESRWQPNQRSAQLSPEQVVEALNIVEPVWSPARPARYGLSLGDACESHCALCPTTTDLRTTMAVAGRLSWVERVCGPCEQHIVKILKRSVGSTLHLPSPLSPAVRRWVERHGGLNEVMSKPPPDEW